MKFTQSRNPVHIFGCGLFCFVGDIEKILQNLGATTQIRTERPDIIAMSYVSHNKPTLVQVVPIN